MPRTINIKGQGDHGGDTYYTTTQNGSFEPGSGMEFYYATTDENDYEVVPFKVPDDAEGQPGETMTLTETDMIITKDISSNPIVIGEGQTKGMVLSFKTASMIGFEENEGDPQNPNRYMFFPMPPQSTYSEE